MSVSLHPQHIVWDTFGNLEPFDPVWLEELDHWESYVSSFFQANGLAWDSAQSNVEACIRAPDKAPFVRMMDQLLPQLQARVDCQDIDVVLLAHWTPDLHLGTSVVNHVIYQLNLSEQSFGLAISDRGLSAPLFAFDALYRYIRSSARRALLLIADQKHLLYRSPLMAALAPQNSACILAVNRQNIGWHYQGYQRSALHAAGLESHCAALREHFGLAANCGIIASPTRLAELSTKTPALPADESLLCSALFAALQRGDIYQDYLLLQQDQQIVTALAFRGAERQA